MRPSHRSDPHPDGTPRYWLIRCANRAFAALNGGRYRVTQACQRMQRRARALDQLERENPREYARRMRLACDHARAMDHAYDARQRARDCGPRDDDGQRARDRADERELLRLLRSHFRSHSRSRAARVADEADRDAALQRAYDALRANGGRPARPGRAADGRDTDFRWGVKPWETPYVGDLR